MGYIDIRGKRTKKFLFRYDPERGIIRIKVRDVVETVPLHEYHADHVTRPEPATVPASPVPPKPDERP